MFKRTKRTSLVDVLKSRMTPIPGEAGPTDKWDAPRERVLFMPRCTDEFIPPRMSPN